MYISFFDLRVKIGGTLLDTYYQNFLLFFWSQSSIIGIGDLKTWSNLFGSYTTPLYPSHAYKISRIARGGPFHSIDIDSYANSQSTNRGGGWEWGNAG